MNTDFLVLDSALDAAANQLIPMDQIIARISPEQNNGKMCSIRIFANTLIFQSQGKFFYIDNLGIFYFKLFK